MQCYILCDIYFLALKHFLYHLKSLEVLYLHFLNEFPTDIKPLKNLKKVIVGTNNKADLKKYQKYAPNAEWQYKKLFGKGRIERTAFIE